MSSEKKSGKIYFWVILASCVAAAACIVMLIFGKYIFMPGKISPKVVMNVDNPSYITEKELDKAINAARKHFVKNMKGCTATEIIYDDSFSKDQRNLNNRMYGCKESVAVRIRFTTDGFADGNLTPDTETVYTFIAGKDNEGNWEIITAGYP